MEIVGQKVSATCPGAHDGKTELGVSPALSDVCVLKPYLLLCAIFMPQAWHNVKIGI